MKIGLVSNLSKDLDGKITNTLVTAMAERNLDVIVETITNNYNKEGNFKENNEFYKKSDVIIVLGGDGTILQAARNAATFNKPILGINLGRLGFLAEAEFSDYKEILDTIVEGNYKVETRMMVEAQVFRIGDLIYKNSALNEIAVVKGCFSGIINLDVFVNDEFVSHISTDGILVSTPTGSTAYSLSAGGPIVHPDVSCLLVTPICPHTINTRPIVTNDKSRVKIVVTNKNTDILLTVDGQEGAKLLEGDEIIATKSKLETKLIRIDSYGFFDILRSKFSEK